MARLLRENEELKLQIRKENERIEKINVINKAKSENEELKLQLARRNEKNDRINTVLMVQKVKLSMKMIK